MPTVDGSSCSSLGLPVREKVGAGLVMVVDDDEAVRTSFAAVLRVTGFEVIKAADSFKELETLQRS